MQRLNDRVALVTGGSSGIGNAIAAAFGREGADVVVADVRREPKLDDERSVFDKLDEADAESLFVETDVTDETAVREAVEAAVSEYGGLDILVNNAGIYYQYEAHETPTEEYDAITNVNLRGTFLCSKAAIPELKDSENAKIINLSSIFGLVGGGSSAAYCASKGGVSNLTRQMSLDYADDEINVNAIAPGIIKTAQNVEWRENNPEIVADWEAKTPWPRFGEPEDVAAVAVFLASDESDFITGDILSVDGGWTAQ
ncbi:MAG: SDR family NAD(P)-dependent oxidoreductase [Halobacteriota archaeon]|uniref:SDR family NAD(P)-dependent oxidoreductase n=1 Tax=Natronomonas sp. TaxID=2184060 RepID=UPI0039770171